ncbi:MAG: hypothetical protein GXP38_13005 [Chloroflexi bacterium]|nr:hypothetical protein [Chloroflexota bacterium]
MMRSTPKNYVLLVLAVLAMLISFSLQGTTQAGYLFDSPIPGQPGPCLRLTQDGYTLEFMGYYNYDDGSTSLTFRLVNENRKDIDFIAFGTNSWKRLKPANGSIVSGNLGDYHMEWTNERGVPGFAGIEFEARFDGFSRGAEDTFTLTVTNFDASKPVQVLVGAGRGRSTFTVHLDAAACNLSPEPTATPTATSPPPKTTPTVTPSPTDARPRVEVYVLSDALFTTPLRAAEKESLRRQGMPVPVTEVISAKHGASLKTLPAGAFSLSAPEATQSSGWDESFYFTDFESDFLHDGGPCVWDNWEPGQPRWWERDTQRAWSGSYAIWPAAHPLPSPSQYPNNLTSKLICQLDNMAAFENLLVQFQMWMDLADANDSIQILFSTDGVNYRGIGWYGPGSQDWTTYRIFYPDLANGGANSVYIMWKFVSDSSGTAAGPWIDDLSIQRYDRPATGCRYLDPGMSVPGVPGGVPVSKGLVVDPNTEDDLASRIQRLVASHVQWVRLEFKASPDNRELTPPGQASSHISHIDLQKYDQFIDGLCANGVAVLGLIDGQTLLRQDWKSSGEITPDYLDEFTDVAALLADYYDDRIRYWEVWNEPDFSESFLQPGEYAELLSNTYQTIKGVDTTDMVLFGGLGSADPNARDYLVSVYSSQSTVPFDVFALHPYVSTLYRYPDGRLMVNPQDYMHYESPTIIKKFKDELSLNGDAFKRIWATEQGWNSAIDSPRSAGCSAISEALVDRASQAHYLTSGFDILFTETGWSVYSPSITKIFWYQYRDTGACVDCQTALAASSLSSSQSFSWSPSWNAAPASAQCPPEHPDLVDWWYGLYQGDFVPKPAENAFREYPQRPIWLPTILRQ